LQAGDCVDPEAIRQANAKNAKIVKSINAVLIVTEIARTRVLRLEVIWGPRRRDPLRLSGSSCSSSFHRINSASFAYQPSLLQTLRCVFLTSLLLDIVAYSPSFIDTRPEDRRALESKLRRSSKLPQCTKSICSTRTEQSRNNPKWQSASARRPQVRLVATSCEAISLTYAT
jgi:hypothetical protein